ncbi:MAG: C40 family peptidase [Saprospiraceae bacterium]|nr:C40 family peptidase [Saprospiraceae bacterium]HMW40191.1 C40 family peptidase [Saprospiraceae bacterium]HMX87057.1 C40 family peptidase [Saprospiraceae bacterium]HMZ41374.1 C40 family peptidase [Saprospiraceae bacterium]HNA65776.1 C40 family peptidase [Saprospiraceae bacterium]
MTFAIPKSWTKYLLLALTAMFFTSCATGSQASREHKVQRKDSAEEKCLRQQVVNYARLYLNKPYRKGGKDQKGFDCSGFVGYVLRNYNIPMAASAQEMYKEGVEVDIEKVKPGDIVFFGARNRMNHVGIITERSGKALMMIHSSSSRGVIEEDIHKSDYWLKRLQSVHSLMSYPRLKDTASK